MYEEVASECDDPSQRWWRWRGYHNPWNTDDCSTLDYYMQIRATDNALEWQHRYHHHHHIQSSAQLPVPSSVFSLFPCHLRPSRNSSSQRVITRETSLSSGYKSITRNPSDCASDAIIRGTDVEGIGGGGGGGEEVEVEATATGRDGVKRLPQQQQQQHNCLVIRRQIVSSNGIALIPLLFLLLLVTTSALPPVIRIGK